MEILNIYGDGDDDDSVLGDSSTPTGGEIDSGTHPGNDGTYTSGQSGGGEGPAGTYKN